MRGTGAFFDGQPADLIDRLQEPVVASAVLATFEFRSGTQRIADWAFPVLDHTGAVYQPAEGLVGIGPISGGGQSAQTVELYLGVPWDLLTFDERALAGPGTLIEAVGDRSDYAGQPLTLWLQHFDTERLDAHGRMKTLGFAVALAVLRMQSVSTRFSALGALLTLRCESVMALSARPLHGYLTSRDQKARSAGDKGLDYVPEVGFSNQQWTTLA